MLQISLSKQGRFQTTHFRDRIATLDSAQGCLFLSGKHTRGSACHHKIVVHEVLLWPRFGTNMVRDSFNALQTMLTVAVRGVKVKATEEDFTRVASCFTVNRNDCGAAGGEAEGVVSPTSLDSGIHSGSAEAQAHTDGTARSANDDEVHLAHPDESHGKYRVFVLRCGSFDTLVQLVKAFESMQPPGTVNTGAADDSRVGKALPHIVGTLAYVERHLNGETDEPAPVPKHNLEM